MSTAIPQAVIKKDLLGTCFGDCLISQHSNANNGGSYLQKPGSGLLVEGIGSHLSPHSNWANIVPVPRVTNGNQDSAFESSQYE